MSRLTDLDVAFVSLVDRAAVRAPSKPTEPQRFLFLKRDSGASPTTGGSMPQTATPEELQAALTKAQEERDAAVARAAKAERKLAKKSKSDGGDGESIDKSDLPPAVRAALEKAEKSEKDAIAKAEEAERIAKEER